MKTVLATDDGRSDQFQALATDLNSLLNKRINQHLTKIRNLLDKLRKNDR